VGSRIELQWQDEGSGWGRMRKVIVYDKEEPPVKLCGRCDEPIQDGEEYTEHPMPGESVAGATIYRHVELCKPVRTQTTQYPVRY
jgi:hypothetical protein